MGSMSVVDSVLAQGLFFGVPPFISPTIISVTSQASLYLDDYLIDDDQDSAWRSTSTAQQDIILDCGAAVANPIVYLFGANFETVSYYTDSSSGFSSPPYSLTSQSIYKDTRTQIRKSWAYLNGANHRYLRIRIPNQTLDGSVSYSTLSNIIICPFSQLLIPAVGHQLPYNPSLYKPSQTAQSPGGGKRWTVAYGRRRVRLDIGSQVFHIDDEEKILKINDEDAGMLVFENISTPTAQSRTNDTSRVYYVKRVGEYGLNYIEDFVETGWVFEEQ